MEVCEKVPKSELDAAGYKIVEGDKPPWTEEIELPVAFTSSSVENFQMHKPLADQVLRKRYEPCVKWKRGYKHLGGKQVNGPCMRYVRS